MGAKTCKVVNDTSEEKKIYVYNYVNAFRHTPDKEYTIQPGKLKDVSGTVYHGKGVFIMDGIKTGHQLEVGNGELITISQLNNAPYRGGPKKILGYPNPNPIR